MTIPSGPDSPRRTANPWKRQVTLLSPILVVSLGFVISRLTAAIWGPWSWIPVLIYYWGSLLLLIAWSGGREAIQRWLRPSQTGRWIWAWRILALLVPALALSTAFLPSLASMKGWWVVVAWFGLGLINSWIEEGYWRGLLLDTASRWPGWLAILYSAIFFSVSHPLLFSFQGQTALEKLTGLFGTLIAALIWGLVYRQTRSLRLPILGHLLQQIFAPPYNVYIQLVDLLR